MPETVFWVLIIVIFYTYLGYGAILWILGGLKSLFSQGQGIPVGDYEPPVTLLVASYNEEAWVGEKIRNSLQLDYAAEKLSFLWITDGSNDGSMNLIVESPRLSHLHLPERRGKAAAINRGMTFVKTEIVILSDANTLLSPRAVKEMIPLFQDLKVGCVCGEKRVCGPEKDTATVAGEGTYWRYESWLKRQEARVGSCVGAAGELFAIRRELFRELEEDTLVDDFMISMRIALDGYRIAYAPDAFAMETGSADIGEDFKRRTRIAAGNLQALLRIPQLLNPLKHGMLTFQYVSHKFLRSFVVPLCFGALIPINLLLLPERGFLYALLFLLQTLFYLMAWAGYLLKERRLPSRVFFVPCYIVTMNLAALVGAFRYLTGKQSVLWEKAVRKQGFPEREEGEPR